MSVPNQKIVTVAKRVIRSKDNIYATVNIEALQAAMNSLKGEAFKLWMYINKNAENYQFEFSQKACLDWGIKKDAYYAAVNKLIEIGYLRQVRDGSNYYIFYETISHNSEIQKNDNEEEFGNSESFSEIPKKNSEIQKSFSEKPWRNNTSIIQNNTINNTIKEKEEREERDINEKEEKTENRKNQKNLNVNDNVNDNESSNAAAINFTNFEGTISEFYSCLEDNKRTDIKERIIEKFREMKKSDRLISTNNLVKETLSNFGIEFTGKIALSI